MERRRCDCPEYRAIERETMAIEDVPPEQKILLSRSADDHGNHSRSIANADLYKI